MEPEGTEPEGTYTYRTGAGAGGSLTITFRVIRRTTRTGRRPSFAASVAGVGEAPSAANGARNASPPVTHAQTRSARREMRRRGPRSAGPAVRSVIEPAVVAATVVVRLVVLALALVVVAFDLVVVALSSSLSTWSPAG